MKKFKNNILFKNILILLTAGALSKIIGMFGKILYTRMAGINVVSLYTLITPTLMLIIAITQFSFPISISKLSAEGKYKNSDLLKSSYILNIFINIILIIIVLVFSSTTAKMLNNNSLKLPIRLITLIIPFVSISSIQRGFLHGKEDMFAPSFTNIIEEILKILLIIILLPLAISKNDITAVNFIILFNIITEISSIFIMNKVINKKYISNKGKMNFRITKDILSISLPTTSVRLISQIGFFIEPIILTNTLVNAGLSSKYITVQYAIINSYIVPILSIPTFFSISIAAALLPNITKLFYNKKYDAFKNKLSKLMFLSIIIGIICLIIILLFPSTILKLVYNVKFGINYLYIIAPFFIILYMQPTLSVAIQAMNKTNKLFFISIISIGIKYTLLYILCNNGFGIASFLYAIITGIIITTLLMIITVIKELKRLT